MLTGLHAPAVQSDLVHVSSQRVAQPCHLHLTCSHVQRRPSNNAVRSRSSRRDASEATAKQPCLSHFSRKHERRLNLSTCAVADELREAAAQSSMEVSADSSAPPPPQAAKPEAAAATSASTSDANVEKQTISPTQEPSASQPTAAAPTQRPSGASKPAATASTPSTPEPPAAPSGSPYRGFRNVRHNSYQKGPDSDARIDMGSRIPRGPKPVPIPPEEAGWVQPGQTVLAKVVYSNHNGFKVEFAKDTRVGGWCPVKEAPYILREDEDSLTMQADSLSKLTSDIMPVGTIREFMVLKVPHDLAYFGTGPMVSARMHDLSVLWRRTHQLFEACSKDKETFTAQILDVNQGGLISRCQSLQAFIPISQLNSKIRGNSDWLSIEDMQKMKGTEAEVTIIEVDPDFKKIVLSMDRADQYTQLKSIHLGALMWGEVRRIEEFGAFVGLEGTRISGLLHISNISRARVESVDDVFTIGERVRCLVMGMDDNFTRISLSTAELEENEGDIMFEKDKVYANAEAQAKLFMEYVHSSKDEADDFDFEGDRQYDGGSYDGAFAGNTKHGQA
ncbi:hypothetical protein ABBQ32_005525 [Trebouxia sp. C0010 RCD-2024]